MYKYNATELIFLFLSSKTASHVQVIDLWDNNYVFVVFKLQHG